MRSTSNFLPALNQSPRNNNMKNGNNIMISPRDTHGINHESNIKLENRVFYVEKATARLIHAFESIGHRLTKIESDNNNHNINIAALSKSINAIKDSNKEFISKQQIVTERLITDIQKTTHKMSQQTLFINKEMSDVRDSIQIFSNNLQNNFSESIKSGMEQCNDLNIQNSNTINSLRKITDQKISHLQQLIVDSQKRTQTQNQSILDIINSNQKNQSEFQHSFKSFFEKFRDSMHQNLTALQKSSQEQISYLDNILRAEVKTRIKNTQNINKEIDNKIFEIKENINQNKRENKRLNQSIIKNIESVKEIQKHQKNANKPLQQMITNLSKQFDESSQQHLTDIKSIMSLNNDTAEKQFNQIKSLQIQIQQIWSKISNNNITNNNNNNIANDEQYMIRPQSYKSEMSSTAAFTAIKHHLSNMPSKPQYNEYTQYIQNSMQDHHIESAKSEFQQLSANNSQEILSVSEIKKQEKEKEMEVVNDDRSNDVEYDGEELIQNMEIKDFVENIIENNVENDIVIENNVEHHNIIENNADIDNTLDDDNNNNNDNIDNDIDDILGNTQNTENTIDINTKTPETDNYSDEYGDDNEEHNNAEEETYEQTITNNDIASETEKALETMETQQNELNDINNADNSDDNDQYSEF